MINSRTVRNLYVLPCCLLLLNLCVGLVSYKAGMIPSRVVRVLAIMAMVLFGGSLIGYVLEPAINRIVGFLHHKSRRGGRTAEVIFLAGLGLIVFWLYYRMYIYGAKSILPPEWRNPAR